VTSGAQTRKQKLSQNSLERREKGKLELRQTILEAAVKLFEEQGGFENFSLRQVAEAVGYSPTTIYLYFRDKDELLFYVAMEGFREFSERLEAGYQSTSDPLERIRTTGRAYLSFALAFPVHYRLMFMQRGDFLERTPPEGYGVVIDGFEVLNRAVSEAMQAGAIAVGDVQAISSYLWSGVHGIASLHIATPYFSPEVARGMFEMGMSVAARGLGAREILVGT